MSAGQLDTVARHLHRLLAPAGSAELTDRQLLERFASRRDEDAFRALVGRHGPLVLGVCRRVLRHTQDAEDAFQATFLVLVQRATVVRWQESIGHWLHETAYRVALKLKATTVRRHQRERQARPVNAPADAPRAAWLEVCAVLDEELRKLPTHYRLPLLLCYLEGQTQDQAARQLGWSHRTLRRRLEDGRERLRARLARRGVALSAALLTLNLAQPEAGAVPAVLAASTVRASLLLATGQAFPKGIISGQALTLAQGMAKGMLLMRMKIALTLLLAVAMAAAGTKLLVEPAAPAETPQQPAAAPKPGGGEKDRVDSQGDPLPAGAVARLGSARLRHGGAVNAVAYSPDGKVIASGGGDNFIRLWDARTGKELRRLVGHTVWLYALAFSPDGQTLASGANDSTVRLWDVNTGKLIWTVKEKGAISSVAFSSDGKALAAGCWDKQVRLLDTATGKCLRTFEGHEQRVMTVALSPDDKLLASGSWEDKKICLWAVATGKLVREFGERKHEVGATRFSPDGKTLATGGIDGPIHLWDVATGKEVRQLVGHPSFVEKLIFTRDGQTLISTSYDKTVRVWDVARGKQVRLLGRHLDIVYGLSLSPDEKTVASAAQDNLVRRWDLASGKEIGPPAGHQHGVTSVHFSSDGKILVTGAKDGTVRVWELATGRELRRHGDIKNQTSPSLAVVSTDGRTLAVAGADQVVRVRDLTTGKELASLRAANGVTALRFSPDGKILACGTSANAIHLWEAGTGKELCCVHGYADEVARLVFSPDGKRVAAGGSGGAGTTLGTIYVWETATGKEVRRMKSEKGVILLPTGFSSDGRMLAAWQGNDIRRSVIHDNRVVLLEVATGRERTSTPGQDSTISAAAFSPDGRTLAEARLDHTIHVWDVLTGQERHSFRSDQGMIQALSFSADSTRLASGGENTTALVWAVDPPSPRQPIPIKELSAKALESLWSELADADAARAFKAMKELRTAPRQTVELLRGHLRPVAAADAERVQRLIADLDAEAFAVRERATKELEKLGESIEPFLRQAVQGTPALELRRRVDRLLDKLTADSPERWRTLRALEVLEWLNTAESRRLLDHLAKGAPGAGLTREAKAALNRLAGRAAPKQPA